MSKFYIATSIAYTNAKPHVGFAMELVQADCLARFHRMLAEDVLFTTGTDEHGMKLAQSAKENNMTPKEFTDIHSAEFRKLTEFLNITCDRFIRTTEPDHKKTVQKLWKMISESGDLYKGKYSGLYCVGCEAYITEKDLVNGNCPNHNKPPEYFEEENYFFRYSKYLAEIKKLIEDGTLKIIPEFRKKEMLNLIESGLEDKRDISFSRPSSTLSWGIPVPDDDSQTMYVWCDALSNYLTGVDFHEQGEKFNTYWPTDVNLIGKDILRFHAGFWIAMLLSAKLPIPKAIYVHGYITSEGQKMSKSIGNVVDPFEVGEKYGVDPLRYYLLREIPTVDDGDFSRERFEALYNGELANNLGNLVSRVLTMAEKYCAGKVPAVAKEERIVNEVLKTWKEYQSNIEIFNLKVACETVFALLNFANQYIDETKPWQVAKTDPTQVHVILYHLLELIRHVSLMLSPFMPNTAKKIQDALHMEDEKLYPEAIQWGGLKEGTTVTKIDVLFPRLV